MTTYEITSESEWNSFSNDPLGIGDVINIKNDIIFSAEPTKVINVNTGTINGQNYTITLPSSTTSFVSLVHCGTGGVVQNIRLNVQAGATLGSYKGWIVDGGSGGTIQRCTSNGDCTATGSAGIVGNLFSGVIEYCTSTGNITGLGAGGIAGPEFYGIARYCYCTGNITGVRAGGIISVLINGGTVYECVSFSTNVTSSASINSAGAIIGYHYITTSVTCISNCYALDGALIGYTNTPNTSPTFTITIENSYTLYTYVVGYLNSGTGATLTLTLNNVIYNNGLTPYGFKKSAWTMNPIGDTSKNISDINQTIPSSWPTTVWSAGAIDSDNYASVKSFEDSSNWTGYTSYATAPLLTDTEVSGDPHIIAFSGERYDYNKIGYSRYFNTIDGKLVVNCLIGHGDGVWSNMLYIRKLFIYYVSSYIEISTGFRGTTCMILGSDIKDDIFIKKKKLSFAKKFKDLCFSCGKNPKRCKTNLCNEPLFKKPIRNKIIIHLGETAVIEVANVNQNNLNPSQVSMILLDAHRNTSQGLVVERFWKNKSKVLSASDRTELLPGTRNKLSYNL